MKKKTTGIKILMFFGIVGLLMIVAMPSMARTIKVNSTDDIIANDGLCTLREAVIAANTDTASGAMDGECRAGKGADTIKLKKGEYKFMIIGAGEDNAQTGDLDILDDLTIKGKGAEKTLIDANNVDRAFHIMSNIKANFTGVTIKNGYADDGEGGGILSRGAITITHSTVSGNTAIGSYVVGGGIESTAAITIINSEVSNNFAWGSTGAFGGGIYNDGTITIISSVVSDNTALGSSSNSGAYGGGIYTLGTMKMTNSRVSGNSASSESYYAIGGGISSAGTMKMTNSTVSDNAASSTDSYAFGGGIYNDNGSTMKMTNVKVSGNTASSTNSGPLGGGIYNDYGGTMKMTNVKISGNIASSINAGAFAGGIYNDGTVKMTNIKVTRNTATSINSSSAGGGIFNFMDGMITVKGISRISHNAADDGGGVYNEATFNKSRNTRIKNNTFNDYVEG